MRATERDVRSPLGSAVRDYSDGEVLFLETVTDPIVDDTFAVRATVKHVDEPSPRDIFFLVVRTRLAYVRVDDLEDVEFTEWPPAARR